MIVIPDSEIVVNTVKEYLRLTGEYPEKLIVVTTQRGLENIGKTLASLGSLTRWAVHAMGMDDFYKEISKTTEGDNVVVICNAGVTKIKVPLVRFMTQMELSGFNYLNISFVEVEPNSITKFQ